MAIFTLEAVKAKHGDSLLLHYGDSDRPRVALIDAGPPGVYKQFLAPRLDELRAKLEDDDGALPLDLVMVSHVDQDHVYGVMQLLRGMARDLDDNQAARFDVRELWHNAFHKLAGDPDAGPERASMAVAAIQSARPNPVSAPVLASVGEGQQTAALAEKLNIPRNAGQPLLLAGHEDDRPGGLKLAVVGPSQARVDALRDEWAKVIEAKPEQLAPADFDDSVFNLSSLIVVATVGERRILLTGDALASDIVDGLAAANLLDAGKVHFDVLKVPHHGSDRNVDTEFFRSVTADHYVISGDGAHGNPEPATLRMLDEARGDASYDVWFTYRDGLEELGAKLDAYIASRPKGEQGLHFTGDGERSLKIDLADAVDY